ncbi:MAG: serine/threonine-protein kinase [bacterium]
MSRSVGEERVLTALAETMANVEPVDLGPVREPSDSASSASNRYEELGEIGRGGLGVVVEAFDQDLRRIVALKRPRSDRLGDVSVLIREAQITAQLEHPNIPAVHTLGIDGQGRPFFTMTRLHGETLGALLKARRADEQVRSRLSTTKLLRILAQVGYAVAFAHDRGVLHRDLKPDNIIIGEFGEVRLMDWGIAKLLREGPERPGAGSSTPTTSVETGDTRAGTFTGTPGYAAPEQIQGLPDIDARADIYALGALLFEMISGRPPVTGENVAALMSRTLEGRVTPLKSLVPVSDPLAAIVHKALAREREHRYANVLALLEDLEAMQEGKRVTALEEGCLKRAGRWYFGRSPKIARLRNIDVDMTAWASYLVGLATGAVCVAHGWTWVGRYWWAYAIVGLVASAAPLYTLLRKERPDDPGAMLALNEDYYTSSGVSGARSTLATAPTEAGPVGDHRAAD